MKTNQEIQAETRQLAALGIQFQNEQRTTGMEASRVLMNFPVLPNSARARHVDAVIDGGALIFRLMERETDPISSDRSERDEDASLVVSSASAHDVLRTGYEMAEEERLTAALERHVDRVDPVDGESATEVEAIFETNLLSAADQLRAKFEIREFLEGRLEPGVLVAHAIERQGSRESHREHVVQRHELKLTIGEP